MFQYTLNNHFKFGYDQKWFVDRQNESDKWTVEYGACTSPVKKFREECISAASKIWDQRNGMPIDILFSGGSDSEIVLRSFLELGVRFNVHVMRFDNYVNAQDWCYAYVVCQNLGIKPIFHDIDIVKFWESGKCLKYAEISKSVSPQMLPHMWLLDQVDGIAIMGSGEPYTARLDIADMRYKKLIEENYSKVPWVLYEREKIAAWYRYPMKTNRPAVPGFFQYTPEIMISFFQDDISQELHANKRVGKLSNKSSKFDIYKKYWPELIDREKYSGFEAIHDMDSLLRRYLRSIYGMYEFEYWSDVDQLTKFMIGERNEMPPNLSTFVTNPGLRRSDSF